jgi:hypothetical protein
MKANKSGLCRILSAWKRPIDSVLLDIAVRHLFVDVPLCLGVREVHSHRRNGQIPSLELELELGLD